ncbi:MAG: guanylate kinase [Magnetococcales bacterium]|nr:guanylate kinase [Magnetococcales bacterium]MBF0584486.1 guanylate kinase [Magnetococcales bacterium]
MVNRDRGFVIILSAPSGAGKSTLASLLVQSVPGLRISVSTTTRAPRAGEQAGVAYHFVDQATFRDRMEQGNFLEWAEVFGNYYGTDRANVEPVLAQGDCVLLDIDWQGARQVRAALAPLDVVSIAIFPPSQQALQERLSRRASDDAQVIARRMAQAGEEVAHWQEYDYLLVNKDLAQAHQQLVAIVTAESLRRERSRSVAQAVLASFVRPESAAF